jgi:HEAT repeat protein
VSQLPLLVADPAKQRWFWESAVLLVGILLALNVLLIAVVYVRHVRGAMRARHAERFRASFAPVIAAIASGDADLEELRGRVRKLDALERPIAAALLMDRLRTASPEQRAAMHDLLREAGAVDLMLRGTRRWRPWRRAIALRTLGWLGAEEGVPVALDRLHDRNRYVREAAVRALGRIGDPRALPELERLYLDPERTVSPGFAYEAVVAFGPEGAPVFRQGLRSPDEHIRVSSCFGIGSALPPERCRPLLEDMLEDDSPAVRAAALESLGRLGGDEVSAEFRRVTRDYQQSVRRAAVTALGSYDSPRALELLLGAVDDPDRLTAARAGESLVRLSRLPQVGAEARAAIEETDEWPVERAKTLGSVGAI